MKNKDWERGRWGRGFIERGGGLINFPPLKRGGLLERGGLIEDLRYLSRIDRLFKRAFKLGYCKELFFFIENIIALKDKKLWDKITESNSTTALDDLLPPEQTMVMLHKRCHNYILPPVRTEHFKRNLLIDVCSLVS